MPARLKRLATHVSAIELHHVIGDQNRLCLPLSRAQPLEIGRVIGPQQDSLAVEHGAIDRQRGDRVPDARESF